jgi:GNAT superfamily N-acetyltransferase
VGPVEQVRQVRDGLPLEPVRIALDEAEGLYALDLAALVVPEALANGSVVCRPPEPLERETLRAWRLAYAIETLGATDSPEQRSRTAETLDRQIADGHAWIALMDDTPVSLSAFNAALPDIVQLGGIYTPPEYRGRGFAKAAVSASLLAARERGATRAVLFTNGPSAIRVYESLGFRLTGDYALLLVR